MPMPKIFDAFGKSQICLSPTAFVNTRGQLVIYGVIGDWFEGLDASTIVKAIDELSGDTIEIRINSPGGSIIDGMVMYNYLKSCGKKVVGYVDGIAASMGCALMMACDEVHIPSNAQMMMHKPNFMDLIGQFNANDLRDLAMALDMIEPSYIQLHADKTGKSPDEIAALIANGEEHYFRGQDAIDYGLADVLIDPLTMVAQAPSFHSAEIPQGFAIPNSFLHPAAAVAPHPQEHHMFRLKTKVGSNAFVALIVTALSSAYATVEEAVASLAGHNITHEILTGSTDISEAQLNAVAQALKVAIPVKDVPAPAVPAPTAVAVSPVSIDATTAIANERKRVQGLRSISALARFDDGDVTLNGWIDSGLSIADAQASAFNFVADREAKNLPQSGNVRTSGSADISKAVAQALLVRANPQAYQHDDNSRDFRGMRLMDVVRELSAHSGHSMRGKGINDIVGMAFHSSSDFPGILADVANKELLRKYREKPKTFAAIARRASSSDFKTKHSLMMGAGEGLAPLSENGEYKNGTVSESKEGYRLQTFGRKFSFGRNLLINDDLSALTNFMTSLGNLAARNESKVFWDLVKSNPRLATPNRAAFATLNGNLIEVATIEAALDAGRLAMHKQKGLDGEPIEVSPKSIVVGPERLTEAQKALTGIQANTTGDVNVFANALDIIMEVRLGDIANNPFYMFADPADHACLEYCYLEGEEEPYMETQNGFDIDGVSLKVRHDFAVGFVDYRGAILVTGEDG